jgi:hypothetical protein
MSSSSEAVENTEQPLNEGQGRHAALSHTLGSYVAALTIFALLQLVDKLVNRGGLHKHNYHIVFLTREWLMITNLATMT